MDAFSRRNGLTTPASAVAAGGLTMAAAAQSAATQPGGTSPEPNRSPGTGGSDPGPRNLVRERENPNLLNPPSTESGTRPNLRVSFADAHVRQSSGGWTRQVTVCGLGISKDIASVIMRLDAGGVREMRWHKEAEWAYVPFATGHYVENTGTTMLRFLEMFRSDPYANLL